MSGGLARSGEMSTGEVGEVKSLGQGFDTLCLAVGDTDMVGGQLTTEALQPNCKCCWI